jgi:hypothetical protein
MVRRMFALTLLVGMLVIAGNAFALTPGTPFSFVDMVVSPTGTSWTHTLDNSDFSIGLSGTEHLKIQDAWMGLLLGYTPQSLNIGSSTISLFAAKPTLDGLAASNTLIGNVGNSPVPGFQWWTVHITDSSVLAAIADKSATISITSLAGTVDKVYASALYGKGVVAPEPVSMALVGFGLAGLPIAGRLRKAFRE